MSREYQSESGVVVNETGTRQYQGESGIVVNETVSAGVTSLPQKSVMVLQAVNRTSTY